MGSLLPLLLVVLLGAYHIVLTIVFLFVPRSFLRKKDIRGQKVLITGAGSGLGQQLAIEFSKHATSIVLVDINKQSLLQTQKLLDQRSKSFIYVCDVSSHKQVYEMAEKVRRDAGEMDILVNNAGIVAGKYLVDLPEEKIVKTMEVNALAHFWTCKAFLPSMMERNQGHVVTIASIAGKGGGPKNTDYCASKFAAIGFSEAIEVEMRERGFDGIKVTIVCPSHIDTGLFRGAEITTFDMLSPEYVAREIVLGVLEEKETIFIPNIFKVLFILKEILPREFIIYCHKISGNLKVMENFIGHHQPASTDKLKIESRGDA